MTDVEYVDVSRVLRLSIIEFQFFGVSKIQDISNEEIHLELTNCVINELQVGIQ